MFFNIYTRKSIILAPGSTQANCIYLVVAFHCNNLCPKFEIFGAIYVLRTKPFE